MVTLLSIATVAAASVTLLVALVHWVEQTSIQKRKHTKMVERAQQGNSESQYQLSRQLEGILAQSLPWRGVSEPRFQLRALLEHSPSAKAGPSLESVSWHRQAAESDHPEAQFDVGMMHLLGLGAAKDNVEARSWLTKAAEQDHVMAQKCLAYIACGGRKRFLPEVPRLSDGTTVYRIPYHGDEPPSIAELKLVPPASPFELPGSPSVLEKLAYLEGPALEGISGDDATHFQWVERAAQQGAPEAQLGLSLAHWDGIGTRGNFINAIEWLKKALEQGPPTAVALMEHLRVDAEKACDCALVTTPFTNPSPIPV